MYRATTRTNGGDGDAYCAAENGANVMFYSV
jgi:hypothetical protein